MPADLAARLADLHPHSIVTDALAALRSPLPEAPPSAMPAFLVAIDGWLRERSETLFDPFRTCAIPLSRHTWRRNATYRDPRLLERYAYTEILGPNGRVVRANYALGLLALAPRTLYPEHAHPADESYIILAGEAEWRAAARPWRRQPPGAVVHHPSGVAHAMRTLDEPLVAVWLWSGRLDEPARMVAPPCVDAGD